MSLKISTAEAKNIKIIIGTIILLLSNKFCIAPNLNCFIFEIQTLVTVYVGINIEVSKVNNSELDVWRG